ncbi:GNAT family N-acetyltransferase [Faecalibacter bovis]|uniref:GNAT family N-acetyltransferase n=1 Tax=Faecalibacter bovis TaxID=2898187 RepID=A0ABX7XAL1_9FLAO|nr:GNAT family protein [Faecalibacter bovis]QTV04832.1 GNAT family N-acetyltransferase [Faecalibacter bovis]
MEILSTKRFQLEFINKFHYENLKEFAFDTELWKFSTIKIQNEKDFKEYFNNALLWSEQTSHCVFVIKNLENNQYVGMSRLYSLDSKNKAIKLGFTWYAAALQGSGINKHCKYLILKYAFENLGMERVELNADLRNERSIAAMKKIGFQQEGILRKHTSLPDGFKRDTIVFSMLKEEWENEVKLKLEQEII